VAFYRLSAKGKRKIVSSAKMTIQAESLFLEMKDINDEYNEELNEIIRSIISFNSSNIPKTDAETAIQASVFYLEQQSYKDYTGEKEEQSSSHQKLVKNAGGEEAAPKWTRDLYKKIQLKTHPDTLIKQNLTEVEVEKRIVINIAAHEHYHSKSWDDLVLCGAKVGIFTELLSATKQIGRLSKLFNEYSGQVDKMQDTISWRWGSNWDKSDVRLNLIKWICQQNSIEPPAEIDIINILKDFEII